MKHFDLAFQRVHEAIEDKTAFVNLLTMEPFFGLRLITAPNPAKRAHFSGNGNMNVRETYIHIWTGMQRPSTIASFTRVE
jgi:hypothetical protein